MGASGAIRDGAGRQRAHDMQAEHHVRLRVDKRSFRQHSPRAAKVLAGVLKAHPAPSLKAYGLSKAVMKPLARTPLAAKAFPPFPLEAALLNLIDRGA